ncbi:MAG: hypothetical protein U5S82_19860 [Gammaproteobacteria bacterium]|nr:hypothetical protein [Gammaproteobacteria bacterium]
MTFRKRVELLEARVGDRDRSEYFRGLAKITGDDPEELAAAYPSYIRCHDDMVLYLCALEENERAADLADGAEP